MKNLLLMRHAKSSWKDNTLNDHQRPLNPRGKRDAPRMGEYLLEQGILLDAILCSTAKRARETAKRFLGEYDFDGEIFYVDDLYHADYETYITLLNQLPDTIETAMIVAHNPGMDYFLEMVCDEYEHMTTAAIAFIRLPVEIWAELSEVTPGELLNLWKPKEI
jgi:phosphohistidine phosphatase